MDNSSPSGKATRRARSSPAGTTGNATKTPRALPKQITEPAYEKGGLRQALVDEGRAMFEENGASELSLRALARRLGVSEAAPSRHFKGKEELLAAIASSGFHELAQVRAGIAALHLDALPKAREMMLSYVRFARQRAGQFDLMTGPRLLQEFVRGDVEAASNVSYAYFADSIFELATQHGWPSDRLHYLSHAAWSMEHGIAALILAGRTPRTDSGLDLQAMVEMSIDLFLSAIVAGPGASTGDH